MPRRLDDWGWTARQRITLIAALSLLTIYIAVRLFQNRQFIPDPLPAVGSRAGELQWKIDLNSADVTTLAAIPRLGEVKAKAIVDYRTQYVAAHSGRRAYEQVDDLFHVKGIGAGTVVMLEPFVMIKPAINSATKPSLSG